MANTYFQDRLDLLGVRKKELDSYVIVYNRNGTSRELTATPGKNDTKEMVSLGVAIVEDNQQDFMVDEGEFVPYFTEPQRGDRVLYNDNEFEVMPVDAGISSGDKDEVFRYTTTTRKRLRIHTKQVGP